MSQPAPSGSRQVEVPPVKLGSGGYVPPSFGATSKAEPPQAIRPLPMQAADSAHVSVIEAEVELVRPHEKLERAKMAAALAAAEAERAPSISPCPSCAAPVSSAASNCGSCGAFVAATGTTPWLSTARSTASSGVTSTGGNNAPTQQQQQPTSSATDAPAWTGGGNAPRPATVVTTTLRDALGGSTLAASLSSPVCPGDLPVLPRTKRVGQSRSDVAKFRRTLGRTDFAMHLKLRDGVRLAQQQLRQAVRDNMD